MSHIVRLLLLEVPRLLRDLLEQAIHTDSDCELLNDHAVFSTGDAIAPDVVILGLTAREDATLVPALFARWPGAQVMTVMSTGDAATLYELSLRARVLGELSPAEVVETVRNSVRGPAGQFGTSSHARTL